MVLRNRMAVVTLSSLLLISVTGCPFGNTRTSNQGGGTIVSAAGKVVGGQLASLSPDEIQIVSDTISDLSPDVTLFVSDDQAAAAIDFLKANNLNSIDDIAAFAQEAANNPSGVVIPESLMQLVDSGIDLGSLITITGDPFGTGATGGVTVTPASQP